MEERAELRYEVPFFQVPDELVKDERTTVYHQAVYGVIAMHANKARRAWPSLNRIAKLTRASRSKVSDTIDQLREFGWLTIEHRRDQETGEQQSNLYTLAPLLQGIPQHGRGVYRSTDGGVPQGGHEPDSLNQNQSEPKDTPFRSGRAFTDYFHARFMDTYKRKPTWPQAWIQQARRLAAVRPYAELTAVVDIYFKTDQWFTQGGRSFGQLLAHYDELLTKLPARHLDETEAERRDAIRRAVS